MIGTLLSVKFIGKRSWMQSIIFWAVALVAGIIATSAVTFILPTFALAGTVVGIAIVLILLHYWYNFPWNKAIVIWVVAFVIDIIIAAILIGALFAYLGPDWLTPYIPVVQFLV